MKKVITFSALFGMVLTVLFWLSFQTQDGLLASQDSVDAEMSVDGAARASNEFESTIQPSDELPAPPPPLTEDPRRLQDSSRQLPNVGAEYPAATRVPPPATAIDDHDAFAVGREVVPIPAPESLGTPYSEAAGEASAVPNRSRLQPDGLNENRTYSTPENTTSTYPGSQWNNPLLGSVLNAPTSTAVPSTNGPRNQALATVRGLRQALASGRGNRKKIESDLRKALSDYFMADMQSRNAQLEQIRKRVESMEQKLQRRMKSHDEVVELQLKLLIHEADGLGFFAPGDELNTKTLTPQSTFDNPFGNDGLNRRPSPNSIPSNNVPRNSPIFPDDEPLTVPAETLDKFER